MSINFIPIVRGHLKCLKLRPFQAPGTRINHSIVTHATLVIVCALAAAALSQLGSTTQISKIIGIILTWSSLITPGFLAVFTILATYRHRLYEKSKISPRINLEESPFRDLIDASVTHTLMGILDAIFLIVLCILSELDIPYIDFILEVLCLFIFTHSILMLFMVCVCLYDAYIDIEDVPDYINGYYKEPPK